MEEQAEELKALQERNPKLSNIVISYRETPLGRKEEYINIVDSNGVDHLLHNVYKLDCISKFLNTKYYVILLYL